MSFLSRIKSALTKTSKSISTLGGILSKRSPTPDEIDELEEHLLKADFGINVTDKIITDLKSTKIEKEGDLTFKDNLKQIITDIISVSEKSFELDRDFNVVVFCGVNGNGKTTTIGKLANKYVSGGKKVLVAACDTFRAAAVDQLRIWAERAGADIEYADEGSDPASVAYKAMKRAKDENYDILFIDTAGRLHNKQNLMDELLKILKIIKKIDEKAPHETILTLDSTTGQNALSQASAFLEVANVTGLIFTKLDGSAKGGSIAAISSKLNLPIYYLSVGEKIDDIIDFNAEEFSDALFD